MLTLSSYIDDHLAKVVCLSTPTLYQKKEGAATSATPSFLVCGHAGRVPLPDGLHLGELLEEGVVVLEALLGALEHLHRLVLADLLDELLEAVLAKLL